jgi:hypothetical protein
MYAIDALGIPAMLERDATITSTDPQTGQPITVRVTRRAAAFDPSETVVVYAATGRGAGARSGEAVDRRDATQRSGSQRILDVMNTSPPLANLITLGARDLPALRKFYRTLGWP